MDFEKKLHQIVNQPSFQKKSDLKEALMYSQKVQNRFNFVRPGFIFKLSLKYKLIFKFALREYAFLFVKKSAAISLASLLLFSFVFTPYLSTKKFVDTSEYLLSSLSGNVFVVRGAEKITVDSSLNLLESDKIIVARNSIAELRVMDSTVLRFGQNSNVVLGDYSKTPFLNAASISLQNGTVWVNSEFKSLVPTKLSVETSQMKFDVFKNSNVVIKSNSNSLLAHNFQKPVTYTYKGSKFVVPKLSQISLNSSKRSSIFESNFHAFVDVNKKLDNVLKSQIVSPSIQNKQVAGLLPGDLMYPLDSFNKWLSRIVTADDVNFQIDNLPETIAEVNLIAKTDKSTLKNLEKDLQNVSKFVKSAPKDSDSLAGKVIKQLSNVEDSLDSETSPEVYFEIKSMISKAKIDMVENPQDKSNMALESTNEILSELSSVDFETKKTILPKVLDELNVVLQNVDKSSLKTASGFESTNKTLETVLEETMVMTEFIGDDLVVEKQIVDKVSELKENLEDFAENIELDDYEVNSASASIEFDSDSELEVSQIEQNENSDLEGESDLDLEVSLENIEVSESVEEFETFEVLETEFSVE